MSTTTLAPAETIDKLRMSLYALERGDTATAELRTRQALELIASHERGMPTTVQYTARTP